MYKGFNTFIDDVFAFIIAMPTAHRVACLRDDIVFFIFLYQMWLYPVDMKRANEYGIAYEEEECEKSKFAKLPLSQGREDVPGGDHDHEKARGPAAELSIAAAGLAAGSLSSGEKKTQ